jgi:hypothetical protein
VRIYCPQISEFLEILCDPTGARLGEHVLFSSQTTALYKRTSSPRMPD